MVVIHSQKVLTTSVFPALPIYKIRITLQCDDALWLMLTSTLAVGGRELLLHRALLQLFANVQELSLLPSLSKLEEVLSSSFMKKPVEDLVPARSRAGEGWRMCRRS